MPAETNGCGSNQTIGLSWGLTRSATTVYWLNNNNINTITFSNNSNLIKYNSTATNLKGFNGKEKDNETYGDGNELDFGARIYDSRLGKFLSTDPLIDKFPGWSPYVFAFDNPIFLIDNEGLSGENPREKFYTEYATPLIKKMDEVSTANKYKALYIVAQKRTESGMKLIGYKGNIYNITGKGDMGSVAITAREEDAKGNSYMKTQYYAVYSSNEKASEAYLSLIKNGSYYKESWKALTDDSKTIEDFVNGIGMFATATNYEAKIKEIFKGVVKDYENLLNKQIASIDKEIETNNKTLESALITEKYRTKLTDKNAELSKSKEALQTEKKELTEFKKNEGID